MKKIICLLIFFVIFVGCKQIEYVYVPKVQVRDSVVTKTLHDSIFVKVTEKQKGDTIYRDSIVYQLIMSMDTITISKTDSIPYPVEVPRYIEKRLNGYQRTFIGLGWTLLGLIVGYIGYKIVKLYMKRI